MNISKKNVFNVKYTPIQENKNINWTSRIIKYFRKNKIIMVLAIVFFTCVGMNLILIYNFLRILRQI